MRNSLVCRHTTFHQFFPTMPLVLSLTPWAPRYIVGFHPISASFQLQLSHSVAQLETIKGGWQQSTRC